MEVVTNNAKQTANVKWKQKKKKEMKPTDLILQFANSPYVKT
jgi:hypothetical protein